MAKALAPDPILALREAVDLKGSQSALARAIGFTQGSVWRWLNGTPVPAEAAKAIERETGVPKHKIRPDIFESEAAPPPANHRPTAAGIAGLEPAR